MAKLEVRLHILSQRRPKRERCKENSVPTCSGTVPGSPMATRSAEDKITEPEGRDAGDEDFAVVQCLPADPAVTDGHSVINCSEADLTDRNSTEF